MVMEMSGNNQAFFICCEFVALSRKRNVDYLNFFLNIRDVVIVSNLIIKIDLETKKGRCSIF